MTASSLTLVPPHRLGDLLRETREEAGQSCSDLATGSAFEASDLAMIEQGNRALAEAELAELLAIYGVAASELVPERTELVIDLRDNQVTVGQEARTIAGPSPSSDEVLTAYLSLVHTLRASEPPTLLTLRDGDVAVLARALELAVPDVERRLRALMLEPAGEVDRHARSLRRRLLLPAIGVAVAVTAVGLLVLVGDRDDSPAPAVPVTAQTQASDATPSTPEVPVRVDSSPGGPGAPQVATHDEDGSVHQEDRQPDPNAPAPPASTTTAAS